jgi:hypothetical protein
MEGNPESERHFCTLKHIVRCVPQIFYAKIYREGRPYYSIKIASPGTITRTVPPTVWDGYRLQVTAIYR